MKVSAIPAGTAGSPGTDLGNINVGRTASPEKRAAAEAAFKGSSPANITESDNYVDPALKKAEENIRRIKMSTNKSPERYAQEVDPSASEAQSNADGPISDTSGQTTAVTEDTKPLSPQFAALARQKRALQVKEREIADRERALEASGTKTDSDDLVARLKSQPLSVLQEHGVTYDQLTEAILANQSGNPEIQQLKAEIKALKEGVDNSFKSQQESAEEAALTEMLSEAEVLAKEGDAYEMIRERDAYDKVLRLIHSTYKTTGKVLDTKVAMDTVETQLLEDTLKLANINKVKNKIIPVQTPAAQQQSQTRGMRTLTNRDTATTTLSAKARALAAFNGTLKK